MQRTLIKFIVSDWNAFLKCRRLMFVDYGMFSTITNSTFDFSELAQKDTVVTIVDDRLKARLFKLLTELTSLFVYSTRLSTCRRDSVMRIVLSGHTWPRSRDDVQGFIMFQRTTKTLYVVPRAKASRNSLHLKKNNDVKQIRIEWTFYGDCSRTLKPNSTRVKYERRRIRVSGTRWKSDDDLRRFRESLPKAPHKYSTRIFSTF